MMTCNVGLSCPKVLLCCCVVCAVVCLPAGPTYCAAGCQPAYGRCDATSASALSSLLSGSWPRQAKGAGRKSEGLAKLGKLPPQDFSGFNRTD